jgi:hypothetical protein
MVPSRNILHDTQNNAIHYGQLCYNNTVLLIIGIGITWKSSKLQSLPSNKLPGDAGITALWSTLSQQGVKLLEWMEGYPLALYRVSA